MDGLFVAPDARTGVFTAGGQVRLGVVVDLSGAYAPESLTVDRTRVLTDVSHLVGDLLAGAASELAEDARPSFGFEWICRLALVNRRVADIVTSAFVDADCEAVVRGQRIRMAETGCTPEDIDVLLLILGTFDRANPIGILADHFLLWRLLAYRPNRLVDMLTESCPELAYVGPVIPGKPTDGDAFTPSTRRKVHPRLDDLIQESNRTGSPIAEVVTSFQAEDPSVPDLATTIRAALAKVPFAQPPPQPR